MKKYSLHCLHLFLVSIESLLVRNEKNILCIVYISRLTRNKCKQCKEYFFHSSLSDFQYSLEINVNNAKNIFFIPHYQTLFLVSLESLIVRNEKNILCIVYIYF